MKINRPHTGIKAKIRRQMNHFLIPATLIPTLLIGAIETLYLTQTLYTQSISQVNSDNLRVKSIILDCTINTFNISEALINDNSIKALLIKKYIKASEEYSISGIAKYLQDYHEKNTFISSITVYTDNPSIPESKYIKQLSSLNINYDDIIYVPAKCCWKYSGPENSNTGGPELAFLRSVPLIHSKYSAVLVIKISNNYLKNRIQNNLLYTSISLDQDPTFFSTIRSMQGRPNIPVKSESTYYNYSGLLAFNNKQTLGHISSLPAYQSFNTIYITTMDLSAYDSILKMLLMCIAIIILAIVIPLLGVLFYTRLFSFRVMALRTAMKNSSLGNYDIIDTLRGDDELTETFSDLKNMIHNITAKEAQMYEVQIQQQELVNHQQKMEFKLLTSQINPHFIYNTLETIRMMALDDGNPNVPSAIKLLAKSMHYVLERTETVSTTLDKELDYIDVYLQIQKLRFGERINYEIDIRDNLSPRDYQILPLLLQPIVENSVLHGLETVTKEGFIKVVIQSDNLSYLYIDIIDNGKGMTSNELENLIKRIDKKSDSDTTNIGLININRRIKLFYGDSYYMNIVSSTQNGTHVHMVLPLIPNNPE